MAKHTAESLIKLFERLKGKRFNWDAHWQEVADYVLPRKNDIFGTNTKGDKRTNNQKLFDSTAIHANELLASALHGMLTNPTSLWFELTTDDKELNDDDEVRKWLQEAAKRIFLALNNTNFQQEIHELYMDLGSIGTGFLQIEEDDERLFRFHARPIYEAHIAENDKGIIDTVFREFKWTFKQVVDAFGEKVLGRISQEKFKRDPFMETEIIHAVLPRSGGKAGGKGNSKPFASVWILKEEKEILKEGGFDEFPFLIPRWTKLSGEVYGRSPAMKSLPDIKMINAVRKVVIRAAQKIVDPPLQMPDDGIVLPLNVKPGGINYYRSGSADRIEPIKTGGQVDLGYQMIDDLKVSIRQAFFIDQLQLSEDNPQMTATEVQQRTEEKLRMLGPILARQQFELLRPLVDRVFGIRIIGNKGRI